MSAKVTIWAWSQKVPTSTARLVLLGMADICRDSGIVWASQQTIADKIQMSLRTVRDAVNVLAELGLISLTARVGRTDLIRFNLTPVILFADGPEADDWDEPTPANAAGTPANGSITPANAAGEPIYNLEDNPKTALARESLFEDSRSADSPRILSPSRNFPADHPDSHDAFEEFWRRYPRKEAKALAKKAFERAWPKLKPREADPGGRLGALLAAIDHQGLAQREKRFVPHPATWLNGERWLDEAPRVGAANLPDWT